METGGIYQIRCLVNGKVYVGSAKSFEWRWGSHLYELRKGTHINPHLQRSFIKHGENNFVFEILEVLGEYDKDLYFYRENFYIDLAITSGKFYNIAKAEGGWTHHTLERKSEISSKISRGLREHAASLTAEERKEKYGKHRGIPLSDETKAKVSAKLKGVPKSDETKRRMSEAQKNVPIEKKQEAGKRVGKTNVGRAASNRRKVQVDDNIFDCLRDAAIFLNSSSSALCRAIKYGKFKQHVIRYIS
jgi:group I intron endonuclease